MKTVILSPKNLELEGYKQEMKLPVTLKDKILLSPGQWNGLDFTKEEIVNAFNLTDWSDKKNYELIYDHEDDKASKWLGNVVNIRVNDEGFLLGDLEIFDESLAQKLVYGKAKLGISARVQGVEDEEGRFVNFTFKNFSIVGEPACKTAYINLSKEKLIDKIISLEKRIEKLEVNSSESVKGSGVGANANHKIKNDPDKKKKKEDENEESIQVKGGQKSTQKMEENEKIENQETEDSKEVESTETEDKSEATSTEEPKEESKDESEESEKPKESEELSSKIDAILSEIRKLSERITKLEDSGEDEKETKEESNEESKELSQKEGASSKTLVEGKSTPKGYTSAEAGFAEMMLSKVR